MTQFLSAHGLAVLFCGTLFLLMLCGVGFPLPEEATFLAAGYAAAKMQIHHHDLGILCLIGLVGILGGDCVPFVLGRRVGMDFLRHPYLAKLLTPKRIARAQVFFRKHGAKTVFCARFVAGLRMPTFFLAASMGVRFRTFLFWDLMGALISCPTSIYLAYKLGPLAEQILVQYKRDAAGFAAGLIVAVVIMRLCSRRPVAPPTPPPGKGPTRGGDSAESRLAAPGGVEAKPAPAKAEHAEIRP
ncbi:MAG: DedA family protein [Planctomycetota bacterium]|nr:DedA family protein [Planctomycetota bacterium]